LSTRINKRCPTQINHENKDFSEENEGFLEANHGEFGARVNHIMYSCPKALRITSKPSKY